MTIGSSKEIRKQSDGIIYYEANLSKTGENWTENIRRSRKTIENRKRNFERNKRRSGTNIEIKQGQQRGKRKYVFQQVFESIIKIIREQWLEGNTDRRRPFQGQKRIAKITEASDVQYVESIWNKQPKEHIPSSRHVWCKCVYIVWSRWEKIDTSLNRESLDISTN